jgi:hypothetical protein
MLIQIVYRVIRKIRAKLKERIEGLRENNFQIGIHVLNYQKN